MSNSNITIESPTTITSSDCLIISQSVNNEKSYRVVVKGELQPEVHFDRSDAVWAVTKLVLGASLNLR